MEKNSNENGLGQPKVSVIIPVYNAEDTLYVCLDALKKQTYNNLEYIFVNDSSTDGSLEILLRFKSDYSNDEQVKIITHDQNMGVAMARNTGLDHATGEYLYYVDADDAIEFDALTLLVSEALSSQSEIVGCNWFLTFSIGERKMHQPEFRTPLEALHKLMCGVMRWNLWLFLVKRELYTRNSISFIPHQDMGEDLLVMIKLFIYAGRVSFVDKPLYHYGRSNSASMTNTMSEVHRHQLTANVEAVEEMIENSIYKLELERQIKFLKLNIKLPLIISDNKDQYQIWMDWFSEANDAVLKNPLLPFRTKVIQWLASKKQYWAVQLYYRVAVQFVYGKLYK